MRRVPTGLAWVSSVCLAGSGLVAANEAAYPPFTTAADAEAGMVVDGTLAEAAWGSVSDLRPFVTLSGGPAKNQTTARVLRSRDTLYIAFTCRFAQGAELKTHQTRRDGDVWLDESVEVFVDPGVSLRKYRHFVLNAAGVQRDEAGDKAATPPFDADWNGTWRAATSRDATAWHAEIAIPFSDLGLKPGKPALVGLNLCRNDQTAVDTTCWSPTQSGFHEPVRFGLLSLPVQRPAALVMTAETPRRARLGKGALSMAVGNTAASVVSGTVTVIAGNERGRSETAVAVAGLAPGETRSVDCAYELSQSGDNGIVAVLRDGQGSSVAATRFAASLPVPREAPKYGHRLAGGEALSVWWAESMHKVHRGDSLPETATSEVQLSAAGNEYEAVQIVLRPPADAEVALSVSDFVGAAGTVPAESFGLLEVAYVRVWRPTDAFGWVGDWPDPLPPLEGPLRCEGGRNQPVWLLAHVPSDTAPGRYRGTVEARTAGASVSIPVSLLVHGFSLTPETHTKTAYGCGPDYGFQGVTEPAQQEQVFDLYMQSCRDHRIAPYSPMARHPIRIEALAPMRKFVAGRLGVAFEKSERLWRLYWDGKPIASQQTSMTHFEGEGVGWQGTGIGWPYLQTLESVAEIGRSDTVRVLDVVGAHVDSTPAGRSFRLTFRVYLPGGDDWFALRLAKMESTDAKPVEVRSYFNIPETAFKAEQVANGPGYAAWSGEGLGFGMLCLDGEVSGLSAEVGRPGVTVNNAVPAFSLGANETREGWGPLVVYFVSEATTPEALAERAEDLRQRLDPADPTAYQVASRAETSEERREGYSFAHDFADFDRAAERYLNEFHFSAFNEPAMPGSIGGEPRFTEEYKRLHRLMYGPVIDHLREKGWLNKAYAYWYDEPEEQAYPHVREGMELLRDNCPGLARLLTEQPEEPLLGAVNLWVPVLSMYRPEDCQARQAAGDQVWWYVCCGPGAPYPNNFVDHPGINHRIRFWMAEKYGVEGSLYWATTFYGHQTDGTPRNPWEDGMTYTPGGGYWGNGDGMLLYPACREPSETPVVEGPVASIRWELLRDGIEDREYFWTLRQEMARLEALRAERPRLRGRIDRALAEAKAALRLPDRLAASLVEYTKEPRELLEARARLARAVEGCRRIQ